MAGSIFESFMQGYAGGHAMAREKRADIAARTAADRYRAGDYTGAESAFLDEGMLGEAASIGDMGERARARSTRSEVAAALTGEGDLSARYQRAIDAAGAAGDIDLMGQISQLGDSERARVRDGLRTQATILLSFAETQLTPEQRRERAIQVVEQTPGLGVTAEQVRALAPDFFTDANLMANARGLVDLEAQVGMLREDRRNEIEDARWERSFAADERHRGWERSRATSGASAGGRRLRLDWERSQDDFVARRDSLQRLEALRDQDTGPASISFIFTYMKMLDPTSVVREGEYATAANAGGVSESVRNAYNRALRGDALSVDIRDEYIQAARAMYQVSVDQHQRDLRYWRGVADTEGVDPDTIRDLSILDGEGDRGPDGALRPPELSEWRRDADGAAEPWNDREDFSGNWYLPIRGRRTRVPASHPAVQRYLREHGGGEPDDRRTRTWRGTPY